MDYRRDLAPPLLALGFSLGLHGALFELRPPWWTQPPPEPVDAVVVEFMDENAPPGPGATAPGEPPAPAPPLPKEPPPPRAEAAPPPPTPVKTAPEPEPEVVEVPLPNPKPTEPPPLPAEPPPPPLPLEAASPEAPLEVAPPPPTVSDLLPTNADLQRFARKAELPDPAAAGVREATLSLGDEDLRYRGYLETVHSSIDRSEKWKEAVLMGGGGGVVVVRMTITSLGQLVSAEVTRSSGTHLLDSAALDAVQRAQIPPFPAHWRIEKLNLHAQFNYQLVTY